MSTLHFLKFMIWKNGYALVVKHNRNILTKSSVLYCIFIHHMTKRYSNWSFSAGWFYFIDLHKYFIDDASKIKPFEPFSFLKFGLSLPSQPDTKSYYKNDFGNHRKKIHLNSIKIPSFIAYSLIKRHSCKQDRNFIRFCEFFEPLIGEERKL